MGLVTMPLEGGSSEFSRDGEWKQDGCQLRSEAAGACFLKQEDQGTEETYRDRKTCQRQVS